MFMRELAILGLHRCNEGESPIVVLEADPQTRLHMTLTPEEAHRIESEWHAATHSRGCCCSTGSIYSLVQWLCGRTGVSLASIDLDARDRTMVVASVRVVAGPQETSVPCQPADALALAIRLRIPVLATETLLGILERRAVETGPGPLPDDAEAAPWLKSVTPEQFEARGTRRRRSRRHLQ
jgi:bifunctional DNase/RNase